MLRERRRKGRLPHVSGGGPGGAGVGGRAGRAPQHPGSLDHVRGAGRFFSSQHRMGGGSRQRKGMCKCLMAWTNVAEEKLQRQRNGYVQPAGIPCVSWGRKSHGSGDGTEFALDSTTEQPCGPGQVNFSEA